MHSGTTFLAHGSAIVQVNMSWQQIFSQPKNNIQTRKRLASFSEVSNVNGFCMGHKYKFGIHGADLSFPHLHLSQTPSK